MLGIYTVCAKKGNTFTVSICHLVLMINGAAEKRNILIGFRKTINENGTETGVEKQEPLSGIASHFLNLLASTLL